MNHFRLLPNVPLEEIRRRRHVDTRENQMMERNLALYNILWMFTPTTLPRRPCHDFLPLQRIRAPTSQKELVKVVVAQLKVEDNAKQVNRKEDQRVIEAIDLKIAHIAKQSSNRKLEVSQRKEGNFSTEESLLNNYEEQVWDYFNFLRVLALKLCKRRYMIREDVGRYLVKYDCFERTLQRALTKLDQREPDLNSLMTEIKAEVDSLQGVHFFDDEAKSTSFKWNKYFVKFTRRGIVLDTKDPEPDFNNWYENDRLQFEDEMHRYQLGLQMLERAMYKLESLKEDLATIITKEVSQKPSEK